MKTHGYWQTSEYRIWQNMIQRCDNPSAKAYPKYGGRGIKVALEWYRFEEFLADMGKRPNKTLSLDRIDNDGNYCKANCRWADDKQQMRNRCCTVRLTYQGITKALTEWGEELRISPGTLYWRYVQGWAVDRILSVKKYGGNKRRPDIYLTWKGETRSIQEWASIVGASSSIIYQRHQKGLPIDKVLAPSRHKKRTA